MSEQKTALTLLSEWVNNHAMIHAYEKVILKAKITELLEIERKQIEDAYNEGRYQQRQWEDAADSVEKYFNQTFKS